jgi:hypothetical protein
MAKSRSKTAAEPMLTFQWKDPDKPAFRLWFFLFLSLGAHVGCFYLFQVVYPKSERALPYTATVTVLDPKDPVAREAMDRVADRVAAIDAARRPEAPGTRLEDFASTFAPFYRDHRLEPKDPPSLYPPPSVPDLFVAGSPSLPPLRVPETAIPEARRTTAPPYTRLPHITVRGGALEKRDLTAPIDWSGIAERFENTDKAYVSFLVGVDAEGRVRHSLLSEGEDTGMAGVLDRKVRALRFVRAPLVGSEGLQWGWIDIRW